MHYEQVNCISIINNQAKSSPNGDVFDWSVICSLLYMGPIPIPMLARSRWIAIQMEQSAFINQQSHLTGTGAGADPPNVTPSHHVFTRNTNIKTS
jgi:hypothetical protein